MEINFISIKSCLFKHFTNSQRYKLGSTGPQLYHISSEILTTITNSISDLGRSYYEMTLIVVKIIPRQYSPLGDVIEELAEGGM